MLDRSQSGPEPGEKIDLLYKIEGQPNELNIFELAKVLESFGTMVKESYQLIHPKAGDLDVRVKPFEQGSFVINFPMEVKEAAAVGMLFFAQHQTELIALAKDTLQTLGFVQKVGKKITSLLDLIRKLKDGKPKKVEKKGDEYEYTASDNSVILVDAKVHNLFNNRTINNVTVNVFGPADNPAVDRIVTMLRNEPETAQITDKEDMKTIHAYSGPALAPPDAEVNEDTIVRVLRPKSGNYGQVKGTWQFYIEGQKGAIKAKISDTDFLLRYSNGEVRFHQSDRLKVKLHERQIIEGEKVKMEYEILEVIDYTPSQPMQKAG
jgi:hypothetical protein